jgi:hypothetical protein
MGVVSCPDAPRHATPRHATLLAVLIAGCDLGGDSSGVPHPEGDASAGTDGNPSESSDASAGSGDATGESLVCTPEVFEEASLLDHGMCMVTGQVVSACSSALPLLRGCDTAFLQGCAAMGGDVQACDEDEVFVPGVLWCDATSPMLPSCTQKFRDTCDELDWEHIGGSSGREGCLPQPDPRKTTCCELKEAAGSDLNWKCNCTGANARSECNTWLALGVCAGTPGTVDLLCDGDLGFGAGGSGKPCPGQ